MNDIQLTAIKGAVEYCKINNIELPLDIQLQARRVGAMKADGDLSTVNAIYHNAITEALTTYFEGGSITPSRKAFKNAMIQAFGDAFDLGYTTKGGELPIEDDAMAWLEARLNQESGFIDTVFEQAKQLRKDTEADYFAWITERADNYTQTTAAIYNAGAMYAQTNLMLTWHLGQTEKHCDTCASLNGKSHKATWYLARNYIPRQPGAAMKCGGYNCDCSLTDKQGNEVTI